MLRVDFFVTYQEIDKLKTLKIEKIEIKIK